MADSRRVNQTLVRLVKGDITDMEVEAFVYYARNDLQLGAGYGNAISMRGGPSVKKELDQIGEIDTCEAVITAAGEMKAEYIVHAVGPKFQEEDTESKLKRTIINALKKAKEKGIREIALPAMGAGFYGVPIQICARIMIETIKEYLSNASGQTGRLTAPQGAGFEEIIICLASNRDLRPFQQALEKLN